MNTTINTPNFFALTSTEGERVVVGIGNDFIDSTGLKGAQREMAEDLNYDLAYKLVQLAFPHVEVDGEVLKPGADVTLDNIVRLKVSGPVPVLPEFKAVSPVGAHAVKEILSSEDFLTTPDGQRVSRSKAKAKGWSTVQVHRAGLVEQCDLPAKLTGRVIARAMGQLRGFPCGNGPRPTVEEAATKAVAHFRR